MPTINWPALTKRNENPQAIKDDIAALANAVGHNSQAGKLLSNQIDKLWQELADTQARISSLEDALAELETLED